MRVGPVLVVMLASGIFASPLRADYLEETGYQQLAAELGSALPDGQGVGVTLVESGFPDYLPEAGSGTFTAATPLFSGKTFSSKSGASGTSGHAVFVGSHFFSLNTNPLAGRATFTPGISTVDIYRAGNSSEVTSWNGGAWLEPANSVAPLAEIRAVQNHSWISTGTNNSAAGDLEALRRFDFAIQRDGFLAVTGVNNGPSAVPARMASAFNNLAVGLSSGNHSTGGVHSWLDGPGRQKPEIVAPLDFTSYSTALVSSAGAFLRQTADLQGSGAGRPETIKSILLTGATKEEFPGWTRTPARPLDPLYGAGELHIGNSWRILSGLEQLAGTPNFLPKFAWSRTTLGSGSTADYLISIPPGSYGQVFSATAVWNRLIRDTAAGTPFVMSVEPLADYQLALHRLPAGSNPVLVDESLGEAENVEHLYQRNLPSGTYRLRLGVNGAANVPASLSWRLTHAPHRPDISLVMNGSRPVLHFSGLIPGQRYQIQSSTEPGGWNSVMVFTATQQDFSWITTGSRPRRFYRLAATD